MRYEPLTLGGNVVRFPVELRAKPSIELLIDVAPDSREVELIAEAFGFNAPDPEGRAKADRKMAEEPDAPMACLCLAFLSEPQTQLGIADRAAPANPSRQYPVHDGPEYRRDVCEPRDRALPPAVRFPRLSVAAW
jgi:hypothetical protein